MAINTFPGVYVTIYDDSYYIQTASGKTAFIPIFAEKGPDNEPILVTSTLELKEIFGSPNARKFGMGWYVAQQYLSVLGSLYIMRVLPDGKFMSSIPISGNTYILPPSTATFAAVGIKKHPANTTPVGPQIPWGECLDYASLTGTGLINHISDITAIKTLTTSGTVPAGSVVSDSSGVADVVFHSVGRGDWYNNVGIRIVRSADVYLTAEEADTNGDVTSAYAVYNLSVYVYDENAANFNMVESFNVSFDPNMVDTSGESMFVSHVLGKYSSYVRAECRDDLFVMNNDACWNFGFSDDIVHLTGGQDDTGSLIANQDADNTPLPFNVNNNLFNNMVTGSVGSFGSQMSTLNRIALNWGKANQLLCVAYTGALINPRTGENNGFILEMDDFPISFIFDAGYGHDVKTAMVDFCNNRGEVFAFLDNSTQVSPAANPKEGLDIKENENKSLGNVWVGAVYEPFTKVYDANTGSDMWVPPMYHFAKAFAKNVKERTLWTPTAGLTYGTISGIKDVKYKLTGQWRELYKENQINPIMRYDTDCFWGNWTIYKKPSALQNIHVVLTSQYIYKTLHENLKWFIWEPNVQTTHTSIKTSVSEFMGYLQNLGALEWFTVNVTASEYDKKNNRCSVTVRYKVVGVIEVIEVSLIVSNNSSPTS